VKRGDVVLVALPGDYGKPRPAIVVQTDSLNPLHESVVICPLTSTLADAPAFRIPIQPTTDNGLRLPSQVMTDKIYTLRRQRIGPRLGVVDAATMLDVERGLAFVLAMD
jgi:mRNA interferase MazF